MSGSQTLRTLLFLLTRVPIAALAFALLVAGWVSVAVLAVTPLGAPALVALRTATGALATLDAWLANRLLGTSAQPPRKSPGPSGFWRAGLNVLSDRAFWRQQAYLLVQQSAGFGAAVAEWTLLAASLGSLTLPIWYRWSAPDFGSNWRLDTLGRSLLGVPAGIIGLVVALLLLRPIAAGCRSLATALLREDDGGVSASLATRRRRLSIHAASYVALNLVLTMIWALTSHGYFWPEWTMIGLGLPLAVHVSSEVATRRVPPARRWVAASWGAALSLDLFFVLVWAVTGRGYFWPGWAVIGVALLVGLQPAVELRRRGRRITRLEKTRAGAVEQQESELERIERDLHDGAQARLVALGMSLGMAEQKLATDPVAAQELLAEARQGTREALEELRSLARGIRPPVLAERGLQAAISALADRTPLQVNVAVDVSQRPPRPVETAAYFVAAEALANAGKHARARQVDIAVLENGNGLLAVEVEDDGVGGADAAGSGLRGLARRVEALDGRLEVISPAGGPTTIRAVMPCES